MPTPDSTTISVAELVAAVDPGQETRPVQAYQFSNGRSFEAGAYPQQDADE